MDGAGLTPLERIELRGLLQDRWRDQVRLVTLLLLAQCEVADRGESTWSRTPLLDAAALEIAIQRARERLESAEQSMRRLDTGLYGWCIGCSGPIGYSRLARVPEETVCDGCQLSSALQPTQRSEAGVV